MTDGFINLDKPVDWTSHDCIARVRRLLNTKKVGHGGTLDPLATGVLPVAVGRATRLLQFLPERKAYRAVIRFGLTTTTDDLEGEVLTQQSAAQLQRSAVEAILPKFTGTLSQQPPIYSAVQVKGKRLYDLARQGKTVEVPSRQITIHQLTIRHWQAGPQPALTLDIDCGPGTYIRSLARDLGVAMGSGATLVNLLRTHSSGFDLAGSMTLDALEQAITAETFTLVPAGDAVQHLAAIALSPALSLRWRMGQKLALTDIPDPSEVWLSKPPDSPLRVMNTATGDFLGIGEIRGVPPITAAIPANDDGRILAPKMVFLAV
ncbi:MAG: tRNA pseudouridine(55) synthase TruB [Phormidesmis sp.]